jgi:hypothetical protein
MITILKANFTGAVAEVQNIWNFLSQKIVGEDEIDLLKLYLKAKGELSKLRPPPTPFFRRHSSNFPSNRRNFHRAHQPSPPFLGTAKKPGSS